jgi:hypothetical protein
LIGGGLDVSYIEAQFTRVVNILIWSEIISFERGIRCPTETAGDVIFIIAYVVSPEIE